MTSNVGQNYPYRARRRPSARHDQPPRRQPRRAGRDDRRRDDAARRERALVGLEVPDEGLPGLLHVAGYARDLHAFTSCATGPAARPSCAEAGRVRRGDGPPGECPLDDRSRPLALLEHAADSSSTSSGSWFRRSPSGSSSGLAARRGRLLARRGDRDERLRCSPAPPSSPAVRLVAAGMPWPAIVLLTGLLNVRHLLYSAAIAPWFVAVPRIKRGDGRTS